MSDAFWQSLFTNLPSIIGAIAGGVVAIYLALLNRGVKEVKQQQNELVKNTNGMTEQLIREAEKRGFRKGLEARDVAVESSRPMPLN